MLPLDIDESEVRVPLRSLKLMILLGEIHHVFSFLQRLEVPAALNYTRLVFPNPPVLEDISRTLGPYMQNRLRRDIRFQGKLSVACLHLLFAVSPFPEGTSEEIEYTLTFNISTDYRLRPDMYLDLMAFVSCEHVVELDMDYSLEIWEGLFIAMPNVKTLRLRQVSLSNGFLQPDHTGPHTNGNLLPSLQCLCLHDVTAEAGWRPLVDYLVHQTLNRQAISLELESGSSMTPEVIKEIEGLVGGSTGGVTLVTMIRRVGKLYKNG